MKITKLREVRENSGLTQVEVAEKANTSIRNYQYYEAGERVPNVYTAQLIAQALHTTVEKIFPLQQQSDGNPTETITHQNDIMKKDESQ